MWSTEKTPTRNTMRVIPPERAIKTLCSRMAPMIPSKKLHAVKEKNKLINANTKQKTYLEKTDNSFLKMRIWS